MSNAPAPAPAAPDNTLPLPRLSLREHGTAVGIEVKDRNVWASDQRTAHFYGVLGQDAIEQAYNDARETFWRDAAFLAEEAGYRGAFSDGRSGGWLVVGRSQHWLDYTVTNADGADYTTRERGGEPFAIPPLGVDPEETDADREEYGQAIAARERFMTFARAVRQLQEATQAVFIENLREAAAELEARREACIIRGEN